MLGLWHLQRRWPTFQPSFMAMKCPNNFIDCKAPKIPSLLDVPLMYTSYLRSRYQMCLPCFSSASSFVAHLPLFSISALSLHPLFVFGLQGIIIFFKACCIGNEPFCLDSDSKCKYTSHCIVCKLWFLHFLFYKYFISFYPCNMPPSLSPHTAVHDASMFRWYNSGLICTGNDASFFYPLPQWGSVPPQRHLPVGWSHWSVLLLEPFVFCNICYIDTIGSVVRRCCWELGILLLLLLFFIIIIVSMKFICLLYICVCSVSTL